MCTGIPWLQENHARGSVGLRFLEIRKTIENPVGPIPLGLRKRRKAVVPRFLRSYLKDKTQGEAVGAREKAPDRRTLQGYLAHKKTPTPLGPP